MLKNSDQIKNLAVDTLIGIKQRSSDNIENSSVAKAILEEVFIKVNNTLTQIDKLEKKIRDGI